MMERKCRYSVKDCAPGNHSCHHYINGSSAEENEAAMNEEMQRVKSGQITYAVRDTVIDDKTIKEGDIMGLGDDGLLAVGENIEDTNP